MRITNQQKDIDDEEEEGDGPKDNCKLVYFIFLLYGVGVLLPFNVLMSCLDFYDTTVSKFCLCIKYLSKKCVWALPYLNGCTSLGQVASEKSKFPKEQGTRSLGAMSRFSVYIK